MTDKVYISKVVEILDNGDAVIDLPPELLKELCWETGDKLDILNENDSIILKNLTKEERDAKHNND